jgi:hypothetical protein
MSVHRQASLGDGAARFDDFDETAMEGSDSGGTMKSRRVPVRLRGLDAPSLTCALLPKGGAQ